METKMNVIKQTIVIVLLFSMGIVVRAQDKPSIAILGIDTKGLTYDATSMGSMVRLELEKTGVYEVLDKYDVQDFVKSNDINIEECYGKNCLVRTGKCSKPTKCLLVMPSGSVKK